MTIGFKHKGQYYLAILKLAPPPKEFSLECIVDKLGKEIKTGDVLTTFYEQTELWKEKAIDHKQWVKNENTSN